MRSKKLQALAISFALFCSFTVAGVAGAQKPDLDHPIQPKSVVKKEFVPTDPEDFIKKNGLRKPSKDAVLVKVVDVDYVYENDPSAGETVHPLEIGGNEYYIKNVGPEYVTYGSYVVASVEESGATNGTLTLSQAVAVANSYNVSVSVNAQIITAAVGYNVTQTWTTTATYSQNVTKDNKITVIDAYDKYYQRSFEVWEDDVFYDDFVTTGTSKRHVGFRYVVWEKSAGSGGGWV